MLTQFQAPDTRQRGADIRLTFDVRLMYKIRRTWVFPLLRGRCARLCVQSGAGVRFAPRRAYLTRPSNRPAVRQQPAMPRKNDHVGDAGRDLKELIKGAPLVTEKGVPWEAKRSPVIQIIHDERSSSRHTSLLPR